MSDLPIERCSTCQAEIIWANHERTLKPMPVNAGLAPPGEGSLLVFVTGAGAVTYSVISVAKRFGRRLRISHYATCPNAPQHRSRGKVAA